MKSVWTKHLKNEPEEIQERFRNTILGSRTALDRLSQLLKEDEDSLGRAEINPDVYKLPGWDYRQADANGYRRCLNNIQSLINLDQKETHGLARPE